MHHISNGQAWPAEELRLLHPAAGHAPLLPHLGTSVFSPRALKHTAGTGLLGPWEDSLQGRVTSSLPALRQGSLPWVKTDQALPPHFAESHHFRCDPTSM